MASKDKPENHKFEQLYKQYKFTMLYAADQILQDQSLAEDAVQTAFMKIANNLHKIGELHCNKTRKFLLIIVTNVAKDMYNDRKRRSELPYSPGYSDHEKESEILLEDIVISDESLNRMQECIAALDKKYADVLQLKCTYEYTESEIAQLLGISYDNVRVRLHRAKKKLRDELEKEG